MAYEGTEPATRDKSAHFTSAVYNPATTQMRQEQLIHGMGLDGQIQPIAPPKPPQISETDWDQAVVRNPDYQNYMPVAVVGAAALLARASGQQEQVNTCVQQLQSLQDTRDAVQQRFDQARERLDQVQRTNSVLSEMLLKVMRKVEVARSMNYPLQADEIKAMERLAKAAQQVERLRRELPRLVDQARSRPLRPVQVTDMPNQDELLQALTEHRTGLAQLTLAVERDMNDLELIKKHLSSTQKVGAPPRMSSTR